VELAVELVELGPYQGGMGRDELAQRPPRWFRAGARRQSLECRQALQSTALTSLDVGLVDQQQVGQARLGGEVRRDDLRIQGDLHETAHAVGVHESLGTEAEVHSELPDLARIPGLAIEQGTEGARAVPYRRAVLPARVEEPPDRGHVLVKPHPSGDRLRAPHRVVLRPSS